MTSTHHPVRSTPDDQDGPGPDGPRTGAARALVPTASHDDGPPAALSRLGWDAGRRGTLTTPPETLAPDVLVGRVCRAHLRASDVLVPDDDGTSLRVLTAQWHPRLVRETASDPRAVPAAGDWVVLRRADRERTAFQLDAVLPRRTEVVRAEAGRTSHGQVLAANVDVAAVVEGLVPDLDLGRLERLLALAWSSGARPLVVLTKADLVTDTRGAVAEVAAIAPGVEVVTVATTLGRGLEPLREILATRATVALLGASGVGKSTLLNALVAPTTTPAGGGPMATRSLGVEGKGRHTTVTRELHLAPDGGAVLDTPGLRTVGLAAGTSVDEVFADVADLAAGCRFRDCTHRTEPGCAVLEAVADGRLTARRLESHRKLEREAMWVAARTDQRLRAELTDRWKQVARSQRRSPKRR
ncbi:ribosome small subunit-dependent GTPase A [Actinotalea sp. AC32]|nr:ribosome small subunit-dependent GTPase A [Actinotalea sp. AC32]